MRKQVFGRKLKRDANERKALLKGLMEDLVIKESIKTTEAKAKAIKGAVEKLITKAKNKGEAAEFLLQPYLSPRAIEKVIGDLSKRFADRPGGYTRIVKLGERFGDNARVALIEWVNKTAVVTEKSEAPAKKATPKTEQKAVAKKAPAKKPARSTSKAAAKKETK